MHSLPPIYIHYARAAVPALGILARWAAQPSPCAQPEGEHPGSHGEWGHPEPPTPGKGSVQRGVPPQPPPTEGTRGGDLFHSLWLVPD